MIKIIKNENLIRMKSLNSIIILAILGVFACDVTNSDDETDYLFKATFTNDWIEPGDSAVVIISDMEGNILAESLILKNESVELTEGNTLNKINISTSENINITLVTENRIRTYLNIIRGSSWKWKGNPYAPNYDNSFEVDLTFNNIPSNSGYIISSKWTQDRSNYSSLPNMHKYTYYENPTNIYLKLGTSDNDKYLWINNVDSDRTIDLSTMKTAKKKTVDLPESDFSYKYVYGISNSGHRYEGDYNIDYGRNYANSLDLYYPEYFFSDYRTIISLFDGDDNYYQSTYGSLPFKFGKIDAYFDFVSGLRNNFEIITEGKFLGIRSAWSNENNYYWYVYSDDVTSKYELPPLTDSAEKLINSNRNNFFLSSAALIDHSEISNFSEYIDKLFKSDELFYDVINDYRDILKYYDNGMAKIPNKQSITEQNLLERDLLE